MRLFDAKLEKAGLAFAVRRSITVAVPAIHRELTAPFAYRNGRLNLIQPVRFGAAQDHAFKTACVHGVEGRLIFDSRDSKLGQLKLVVVGFFEPEATPQVDVVNAVLARNNVGFYPMDTVEPLLADIAEHVEPPLLKAFAEE